MVLQNVLTGDGMLCYVKFQDSKLLKNRVDVEYEVIMNEDRLKARVLGLAKRHFRPTKIQKITVKDNTVTLLLEPEKKK